MRPSDPPMPPENERVATDDAEGVDDTPPRPPPPDPPALPSPDGPSLKEGLPARELDTRIATLCAVHRPSLVRMLSRRGDADAAEDAAQDALAAFVLYCRRTGQEPRNVGGFLADLARKALADHRRAKKEEVVDRDDDVEAGLAAPSPNPEEQVDRAEHLENVKRWIEELPPGQRDAIRHVDFSGETLETAATALRRPLATVAWQHRRGLERLKELACASDEPPPPRRG